MRQRITTEVKTLLEHQDRICGAERLGHLVSIQNEMLGLSGKDESIRKFRFLCYESESKIVRPISEYHRAEILRSMIFDLGGFKSVNSYHHQDLIVLSTVINKRIGHPLAINLLLTEMGAHCGLQVECVKVAGNYLAKVIIDNKAHYLDPCNSGKYIECDEFITLLETDAESTLCAMTYVELIKTWMKSHSQFFSGKLSNERMILFYDIYLALEPNNLATLIQRARLLFDMLDEKQAWYDFKRYFLLADPEKAPQDARKIYSYLKRKFEVPTQQFLGM